MARTCCHKSDNVARWADDRRYRRPRSFRATWSRAFCAFQRSGGLAATDSRPASTTHQIVDKIHDHIQACGFVIADLTNERPNVYYEIGYAMGLGKKLVLTAKKGSPVHFDLQGYTRIEWSGSENLKEQLRVVVDELARSFGLSPS